MMHMEHRLAQTQTQRLMLTQKMQQAIHILQLSGVELEQYVQQELETNPVLDQLQKEVKPEPEPKSETTTNSDGATVDDSAFNLDDYASSRVLQPISGFRISRLGQQQVQSH